MIRHVKVIAQGYSLAAPGQIWPMKA